MIVFVAVVFSGAEGNKEEGKKEKLMDKVRWIVALCVFALAGVIMCSKCFLFISDDVFQMFSICE